MNQDLLKNDTNPSDIASVGGDNGGSSDHFDFVAVIREHAKIHGLTVDALLWKSAKAMFDKAAGGDAAAAKLIFDRACGMQDKGGGINVNIDNRKVVLGPPAPAAGDVGEYIAAMNRVAAQIGVVVHDEPDALQHESLEDLLS